MSNFQKIVDVYNDPGSVIPEVSKCYARKHFIDHVKPQEIIKNRTIHYTNTRSYSQKTARNTSGVRGVWKHNNLWEAYITTNKKKNLLYRGPSFEDAVRFRKEAEQNLSGQFSYVVRNKNTLFPKGVSGFVKPNGKMSYMAYYHHHSNPIYLYCGRSLCTAINKRKEWELQQLKEKPFKDKNSQLMWAMKRNNKSGVTGVRMSRGKYWVASGMECGKVKTLYHGKSKAFAIRARKAWEKKCGLTVS